MVVLVVLVLVVRVPVVRVPVVLVPVVRVPVVLAPVVRVPVVVVVPARDVMGSLGVWECRLTGSRYFGTHRPDSDWDFFAQDSPIARAALLKDGFVRLRVPKLPIAESGNVAAVFWNERKSVHVQLLRDPRVQARIQAAMKRWGFGALLCDKRFAAALWRYSQELIFANSD